MQNLNTNYRMKSFYPGENQFKDTYKKTGIDFKILKLEESQEKSIFLQGKETAVLLLSGKCEAHFNNKITTISRSSWKKDLPFVFHLPSQTALKLKATTESKFAIVETDNLETFEPKLYEPKDVFEEHRGKDILDNACYRLVRLVFDRTIAPKEAKLVIGEVINFPGRWSSYPPHHHVQPELYYYEFDPSYGYGHGELGNDVYKIKHQDLLSITDARDHSQVSAPGFTMYYIWTIRHLDSKPYNGFEYTKPYDKLL
ncbi:MAG: hypothetical protein CMP11_05630 [Zetaproteobacteria bacterium]|nr:hypothetical protein [Pseudobdellovibrionaceae bacterium]